MADVIQTLQFKRGTKENLELVLRGANKPAAAEPVLEIIKDESTGVFTSTKLKIGDGVRDYADLPYFVSEQSGSGNIYQVDCEAGANHIEEIGKVCTEPKKGYIAIVRERIATGHDKRQYTAYIYDTAWVAMDGNYSAENVYFAKDIIYTKAIGELPEVPTTGSATLAAAGKNVKQIFDAILAQRKQPEIVAPSVSISGQAANDDLEIGTTVSKSGTLAGSLNSGSYTYGPIPTGVTATGWIETVEYTQGKSGEIASGTSATLPYSYSFQLTDTVRVTFTSTANHTAGAVAKDNLGDDSNPVKQIAAGSKNKSASATYTCHRKMFYGIRTDKTDLDSAKIRALSGKKSQAGTVSVSLPVGALRTIIAVPSSRTVTSIKDKNGMGAEILSSFTVASIAVEGAEGYTAENYKVYYLDYAEGLAKANTYDVTIV